MLPCALPTPVTVAEAFTRMVELSSQALNVSGDARFKGQLNALTLFINGNAPLTNPAAFYAAGSKVVAATNADNATTVTRLTPAQSNAFWLSSVQFYPSNNPASYISSVPAQYLTTNQLYNVTTALVFNGTNSITFYNGTNVEVILIP